jgi:hypothetical protein
VKSSSPKTLDSLALKRKGTIARLLGIELESQAVATKPKLERPILKGTDVDYAKRRSQLQIGNFYCMQLDREIAVGKPEDFPFDELLGYLITNAD